MQRHYSPAEYERIEGAPLSTARLCAIWKQLPESERFAFVCSLEETVANKVIEATAPAGVAAQKKGT